MDSRLTDMGYSTPDRIVVRGLDLADDVLGKVGLSDMAFLEITGRLPTDDESAVFDAVLVTLVEHGLTPSSLAARLTLLGAPDAIQAAVAAGVLGVGGRFVGSVEGAARMLQQGLPSATGDLDAAAEEIVARHADAALPIPGIGHPVHKQADPRAPRLFAVAGAHGFSGSYVDLMGRIAATAGRRSGAALPVNGTGAVAAVACELGLPWQICRGLAVISRTVGLVGHLAEELERPMARRAWSILDEQAREEAAQQEPEPGGGG